MFRETRWVASVKCACSYSLFVSVLVLASCSEIPTVQDDFLPAEPSGLQFNFSDSTLSGWETRSFKGETEYRVVELKGQQVLQAKTTGQASLLFRQQDVDLKKTPYLRWRWRVANIYPELDERTRGGDDYPARVYVLHQHGFTALESFTMNYVWSSNIAIDQHWPNAFSSKATMLALQSGQARVGEWVFETRNVVQDFKQYFNIDIDAIQGFAVMVDGDNAGNSATAWFDDIEFLSAEDL